ncbi:MAG TPA: arginase family protein [Thermoanaerobaculia bacterium]|nr:arginase family protein [Thermoanaerobaculia bacterium]
MRRIGAANVAERALGRLTSPGLDGFWLHVDVDVLDPAVMPAVDSPEPGGLSFDELRELLTPLVHHAAARGLKVAIYDPLLDPERVAGAALVEILAKTVSTSRVSPRA